MRDIFYVRENSKALVEPVVLRYKNDPPEIATDKFMMYHIQLPAFRREYKTLDSVKGDAFLRWLYMFDRGYQDPDEMEVLSGMTEGLLDFAKRYNIAINDPDLIRRYRMIEDGKRDIATRISVAEKKAKEEGLEEGRVEGLETLVTSLKKLLPDFDHVYAAVIENKIYANLTEEQVKKYY